MGFRPINARAGTYYIINVIKLLFSSFLQLKVILLDAKITC